MSQRLPRLTFTILCLIVLFSVAITAQTAQTTELQQPLEKGTIESQINYVIDKASTYEDYKVIKAWQMYTLRTHILDTLKLARKQFSDAQTTILLKTREIDSLKTNLQDTNDKLNKVTKEKNSLRFMGILMSKLAYNSLMWMIIAGLAVFLVITFILFKRSNIVTVQTKQDLQEIKDEFEAHRKRALEREAKIERKYLDELLKYKK